MDEIVNRWAHFMKGMKSTNYELRPLAELKRSCRECFEGISHALAHNSFGTLRDRVEKKARVRSAMGFRVSEVQRALFGFKEVALPFIRQEYQNDLHLCVTALGAVDACLNQGIYFFTEAFQNQLSQKADTYLKEIEQFNQKLEHLSVTDGLTGLYNQRYFREMFKNELARSQRYTRPLSLVLFDIDEFKQFNDTYGHLQGDEALVRIARSIREGVRSVDIAARYGGEEFVLILPETNRGGAFEVAEKIRTAVSHERCAVGDNGETASFTVSAGVASTEDGPRTQDDLIRLADQCLYRAKKSGKNRVSLNLPKRRRKSS